MTYRISCEYYFLRKTISRKLYLKHGIKQQSYNILYLYLNEEII